MSDPTQTVIDALNVPNNPGPGGYAHHASKAEAALTQLSDGSSSAADFDDALLLQLTVYTDRSTPWSTSAAALTARSLLASLPQERSSHFIVDTVLQRHLRPIFSQATAKVTSSGRPSQYPDQDAAGAVKSGMEEPAWKKKQGLTAIPTFAWAVEASYGDLIKTNWPLFTPVILTLLEDRETPIRKQGIEILAVFLTKCPPKILTSTGIGTVFQEAVFPTLLYLPALTPESESVILLRPAFAALLALAKTDEDPESTGRRKQLDKLLRDGVFAAYHHSSEYIRIVEVLMDATTDIVAALCIFSAKHLQSIMSMIAAVMTDPFATAHGPAIAAASKALNCCVTQCWPRMAEPERAEEVTRIIIVCWLNIHSAEAGPKLPKALRSEIEMQLKLASKMLNVLRQEYDLEIPAELLKILKEEPQLVALFPHTTDMSSS